MRQAALAIFAALILSALTASSLRAEPRPFAIPAGSARATLREFARQPGEQFIFSSRKVSGVSTRAVRGDFEPVEALALMLAGTPLAPVKDDQSGALSVSRLTDNIAYVPPATGSDSDATVLGALSVSAARMN